MKKPVLIALGLLATLALSAQTFTPLTMPQKYKQKVDSVLKLMTLDEKIGQLNQISDASQIEQVKKGQIGSFLGVKTVQQTRQMQEYAMQSRLRIPLLFGLDVIHGYRTIYPLPLAEAASFNLPLMQRTAAAAAKEAASDGVHWTFAPMVDVARDARWGRVMEGAGEDTWYGSLVAKARVKGFQGTDLSSKETILACAKHFAAYGASIGGKDYNTVDISPLTLHEVYLPPFKAAVDAGVGSFMNAFNEINGIPATAETYIQRTLLKGKWGFKGLVISDWQSIREMVPHGYVADLSQAGQKAILAGCDIDMESQAYHQHLAQLITKGIVPKTYLDDAVRRVLLQKFQLGLFDDPFRYCDEARAKEIVLSKELIDLSRQMGKESIVLLKNENQSLPISSATQSIAVIGSLAKSQHDMLGYWANEGIRERVVTVYDGLKNRYPQARIEYAEGYNLETNELHVAEALEAAKSADVLVVAVGERGDNSGEGRSRSDISIPANHQLLVSELKKTGKKLIVLVMGGRPLIFNDVQKNADAILFTWWLGTEAGNAIADVISGDYNPSGKLPMTFPAHIGQVPIYYNYKSTGRPEDRKEVYTSKYQDIDIAPAYPFGYGLSYSTFDIASPMPSKTSYAMTENITITVKVKNTGKYKGKETVQLYIRDLVSSVTRPIKELRGFQQVELNPMEEKEVTFKLTSADLGFYNQKLQYIIEPGDFAIMVGSSSGQTKDTKITLK